MHCVPLNDRDATFCLHFVASRQENQVFDAFFDNDATFEAYFVASLQRKCILDYINKLRNRIAHHEPICFSKNPVSIDTKYVHNRYNRIMELFRWMNIDGASLLYELGHVDNACNQIDTLMK